MNNTHASPPWTKPTRYLVLSLAIGATIWLIAAARPLISPIVISALLAFVLSPGVNFFTKRTRLSRNGSVNLVYLLFLAALIAIPSIITPPIVRQVAGFSLDMQRIESEIEQVLSRPIQIGNLISLDPAELFLNLERRIVEGIGEIPGGAVDIVAGVTENLVWVLVILVTTFYLMRDGPRIRTWLENLAPTDYRIDVSRLLDNISKVWRAFLFGQIALMLAVGILTAIATGAVGLPGAIVLGIVAGLLDVVPSLGPTVAGFIAVIVAFFVGSTYLPLTNFWFAVIVLVIFIIVEQVKNIWLRPQIMGYTLHLHPGIVLVGVLGALALLGILGALVIIPVMASVNILIHYVHCKLLAIDPWENDRFASPEAKEVEPAEEAAA